MSRQFFIQFLDDPCSFVEKNWGIVASDPYTNNMSAVNHPHTIRQKEERIRSLEQRIDELVLERNDHILQLKTENADNRKRITTLSRNLWTYRFILFTIVIIAVALVNLVGISRIFEFAWDAFNRVFLNYTSVEPEVDVDPRTEWASYKLNSPGQQDTSVVASVAPVERLRILPSSILRFAIGGAGKPQEDVENSLVPA
jgi:hypothetical protein